MLRFPQQFLHLARPLLFRVEVIEVLQVPEQVCEADLMVSDLKVEVRAVPVCVEDKPDEVRQDSVVFQGLYAARPVGEHVAVFPALQAPEPAKQLVDVHACLVHARSLFLADVLQQALVDGQCLPGIPLQYVLDRPLGE